MVRCKASDCQRCAHSVTPPGSDRYIHSLPMFEGMSCFQIMHSPQCKGLWTKSSDVGTKTTWTVPKKSSESQEELFGSDLELDEEMAERRAQTYAVKTSHPIYVTLRDSYGLQRKKKKTNTEVDEEDDGIQADMDNGQETSGNGEANEEDGDGC